MIEIKQLDPTPEAIDYAWSIFSAPEIKRVMPSDYSISEFVQWIDMWRVGFTRVYLPLSNGEGMGICHGNMYSETQFIGHYSFLKKWWGKGTRDATKACMARVQDDLGISKFVGLIPKTNPRSKRHAMNLGFTEVGEFENDRYGWCWDMRMEI